MLEPVRPLWAALALTRMSRVLRAIGGSALALSDRLERTAATSSLDAAAAPAHGLAERQAGPPAHWQRLVAQHAPSLLESSRGVGPSRGIALEGESTRRSQAAPPVQIAQAAQTVRHPRPRTAKSPSAAASTTIDAPRFKAIPASAPEPISELRHPAGVETAAGTHTPSPAQQPLERAAPNGMRHATPDVPASPPASWRAGALRFQRARACVDSGPLPVLRPSAAPPSAGASALADPTLRPVTPFRAQAVETWQAWKGDTQPDRFSSTPRWPELPGAGPRDPARDTDPWPALQDAWDIDRDLSLSSQALRREAGPWSG